MNTKAEERAALEKIKKILSELDADGYVNTAFKGCVEDAETNIENDWSCSMADRYAHDHAELEKSKEECSRVCKAIDAFQSVAITNDHTLAALERACDIARMHENDIVREQELATFAALDAGDMEAAVAHNDTRARIVETIDNCVAAGNRIKTIRQNIAGGMLDNL